MKCCEYSSWNVTLKLSKNLKVGAVLPDSCCKDLPDLWYPSVLAKNFPPLLFIEKMKKTNIRFNFLAPNFFSFRKKKI